MNSISRFLSWVFMPLNAPVIALLIVLYVPAYTDYRSEDMFSLVDNWKYFLLIVFTFFSLVVPGFTLLFLRFSGAITSVTVENRKERILPAFFVNISAIALYYLLRSKDPHSDFPSAVYALSIGSTITVLICTIVTRWWKISLHSAGMGIIGGFVLAYYSSMIAYDFWIIPASLITGGIVMSARMYLGKHDLLQCLAGYFTGSIALVTTVLLLKPH
jgi:hypothetical protein